jgi:hypothetical protein
VLCSPDMMLIHAATDCGSHDTRSRFGDGREKTTCPDTTAELGRERNARLSSASAVTFKNIVTMAHVGAGIKHKIAMHTPGVAS